jgi:hypothetical protein
MPRRQEHYCAKLVSDALGRIEYRENYRFEFLRGNPTSKRPNGVKLPVDAYYPSRKLVLEFRERQHYTGHPFFDGRITATGESRKEQRQKYDKKREDLLPANGIKLLVVYDYQLKEKREDNLEFIRDALKQLLCAPIAIYNHPEIRFTFET